MIVKCDESGHIDTIDAEGRLYLECMNDDHYILLNRDVCMGYPHVLG